MADTTADRGRSDEGRGHEHRRGVQEKKKTILCVGNTCVDFVNIAGRYPDEDTDQRGLEYYWQRGGNASNSCTVLSILSIPCEYLGVLSSQGIEASWIKNDFDKCGIVTTNCVMKAVECPVATIVLSQATGSRTILFYPRDHPELAYTEFHETFHGDFSSYSWIHFELRKSVTEVSQMIGDVTAYNDRSSLGQSAKVTISLEVEKPDYENAESIMHGADVVFISKDFAKSRGFNSHSATVEGLYHFCKDGALLICAWGEVGAAAHHRGTTITAAALSGINVIDTLGAGDTFNAGIISYLWSHGWTSHSTGDVANSEIRNALEYGCFLSGQKCTLLGYQGLKELVSNTS